MSLHPDCHCQWSMVQRNLQATNLLTKHACFCLQTSSRDELEERTDLGLVKGHAYGVTAVKKVSIGGTGLASFFRLFVQTTNKIISEAHPTTLFSFQREREAVPREAAESLGDQGVDWAL